MSAYLFTAIATLTQMRIAHGRYGDSESLQTWDACRSSIVFASGVESARERFEKTLFTPSQEEKPLDVDLKSITSAQFTDKLLTETGPAPLLWADVIKQVEKGIESVEADDFEQGYWVDVDTIVPSGQQAPNIQSLQQSLSADITGGLNWSANKQFFYLLTVLSPPAPSAQNPDGEPDEDSIFAAKELEQLLTIHPQGAEKEAVVLVQARNSVVAAWLWRRYVASAPLGKFQIRIDPWCDVLGTPG